MSARLAAQGVDAKVAVNRGESSGASEQSAPAYKTLAASTVGSALGYTVIGYHAFGLFVLSLSAEFGWGRGDISIAFLVMSYTLVFAAPICGGLVDRYGIRRTVLPALIAFGSVIASLALLTSNITHFYVLYCLVALTGAGVSPPSYSRAIVQWFVRRRGLALSIALAGSGVGMILVPIAVQASISNFGWRYGYVLLSLLIFCVAFPACFMWLREPGGGPGRALSANAPAAITGQVLREAARTRHFWQMAGGFFLLGIMTSGISAHLAPLLRDRGADATSAALAISLLGAALMIGRLATGWLLDRLPASIVVTGCLLAATVGLAMFSLGARDSLAFAAVGLIGFAMGSEMDFMAYLVSRYHGVRAYTQIFGIFYGVFILGSGIGPVLMGYSQQMSGSYDGALGILCLLSLMGLVPLALLGAYPDFDELTTKGKAGDAHDHV